MGKEFISEFNIKIVSNIKKMGLCKSKQENAYLYRVLKTHQYPISDIKKSKYELPQWI